MSPAPPVEPAWLQWSRKLQAIAQNGLLFSENVYDRQRYEAIRDIAAQMMAAGSAEPLEVIAGLFSAQAGYATPKVDVRGVVFREGQILLVREAHDGLWALPGGWVDPNESPSEAVTREIFEEAGFTTRALKLLAVFDRAKHAHVPPYAFSIYKLFIHCQIESGQPRPSIETLEVAFFPEDRLPALSIARITPAQIARCFQHLRHPEWPADFD
jgi:ADP-ribose pyrophosphatase YjhB (NUDIX family)